MTRFAKIALRIPAKVEWKLQGQHLRVKGAKGETELEIHKLVSCRQDDGGLFFVPVDDTNKQSRALAGTFHQLAKNIFIGVTVGFTKSLELHGVGYRVEQQGNKLKLALGYSNPIIYALPQGIEVRLQDQTKFSIHGIDKQQVGQVAAEIRNLRRPDPYKGKGVRYADEEIILKETKKK